MANIKKNPNIHTISILVANKPGVLVRCAQIFTRRGYNIDALVVSPSINEKYSRMTITAQGDPQTLEQIIKQTGKLIDVIHVSEHTGVDSITKEFALIKVKLNAQNKAGLKSLLKKLNASAIDETENTLIVEKSGTSEKLDELEDALKRYGILEMVRSGKLVIAKGKEST